MTHRALLVSAAYAHHAAARRLVHRLKYAGLLAAGEVLAGRMAQRLPAATTCLVPIPRATARRIRHGIDPASILAHMVGARTGIPVVPALRAPFWWPRHATRRAAERSPVPFRARTAVDSGAVLVDDVVTTGATVHAAQRALGGGHSRNRRYLSTGRRRLATSGKAHIRAVVRG